MASPQGLSSLASFPLHSYLGVCALSLPRTPLACVSPKLVLAPWACEQLTRMAGLAQLLLLGEHIRVGWQGTKPLRLRGLQRVDFRRRFRSEIIGKRKWGQTPGSSKRAGHGLSEQAQCQLPWYPAPCNLSTCLSSVHLQ